MSVVCCALQYCVMLCCAVHNGAMLRPILLCSVASPVWTCPIVVQGQDSTRLKPSDTVSFVVVTDARGKERSAHGVALVKVSAKLSAYTGNLCS